MRFEYRIDPRKVGVVLGVIALFLTAQSLLTEYLSTNILDATVNASLISTLDLFSVNAEDTIPTWYSTLLLFGASAVLAFISLAKRASRDKFSLYWLGLTVVFVYLSMDEGAVIHEIAGRYLSDAAEFGGYLTFAWLIVAAPLVALFGLLYIRFLLGLPPQTRRLFVLAGLIYVGGAILIEAISANQFDLGGVTFNYLAIATLEECCEMLGIVVFIYALLTYAGSVRYAATYEVDTTAHAAGPETRYSPFTKRKTIVLVAVFVIVMNVVLVAFAVAQAPTARQALNSAAAQRTESILYELAPENVLVIRMVGLFSPDNIAARRLTASLFDIYDEVMVISLMSAGQSFALAGDELPFDRVQVTDVLHDNGEIQFLIFDTPAVWAMSESVKSEDE